MTVEVSQISRHGIWLLLQEKAHFLSFDNFPWLKSAPVSEIKNVELLNEHHLYWPDLDIDLAVESIEHPERFPVGCKLKPSGSSISLERRNLDHTINERIMQEISQSGQTNRSA